MKNTSVKRATRYNVLWTNKCSNDKGYVKCIHKDKGYFEHTPNKDEALQITKREINSTIKLLDAYCEQNSYSACEA